MGRGHKNPLVPGSNRNWTTCSRRGTRLALASIWGGSFVVRITEVSTLKLRFTMTTPMADAIHYMPERNLLLVQITTDDGLVGLGECAAYGGSLDSMERVVLDDLQPSLIGEDPFLVEWLWSRMARRSHQRGTSGMLMQAISGVDIALWDLIGLRSTAYLAATGTRSKPMPRPGSTPVEKVLPSLRKRSAATPNVGFAR